MATDLGTAYVQIVPSAKGISGAISSAIGPEAQSAGIGAGKLLGSNLVGMVTGAIATAGIGKILTDSLLAGADLQQSFGGLDTIYAGAEESAKSFAKEAYKAGISANTYAEQAVSMGASLKQALGGDSTAAINMANKAILDMADNSAKMGTDIGIIQQTYQSLARGNYAMLDNLKLGFGGTKAEMERLLVTAEALPSAMGRDFDISNYADVVEAIHLVQESMGLSGVAAAEAEGTFTGSLNAMKASWMNVKAGLSLGEDIGLQLQALATTTSNFLFNNFIPMVGNVFKGLPSAIGAFITQAAPAIGSQFQSLLSNLGVNIDIGGIASKFKGILTAVQPVISGLQTAFGQLPELFQSIASYAGPVIDMLMAGFAKLDFSGIQSLISSILPATQAGFETFMSIISPAIDKLVNSFVNLWNAAQPLISVLADALTPAFQVLGSFLGGVFNGAMSALSTTFDLVRMAIEFLTPVFDWLVGVFQKAQPFISGVAEKVGFVIGMFGNLGTASQGLGAFMSSAWSNITRAIQNAASFIDGAISWVKTVFSGAGSAAEVVKNIISVAWMAVGDVINSVKSVISGAMSAAGGSFDGFRSTVDTVAGGVKVVIDNVKGWFDAIKNIDISGAGAAIMEGFLGGLKSAWGAVTDFVGGIADWIAENKGPISYDRVLLKPAGLAIMDGFNKNLQIGFKDVMSTVSGMASEIAKPFDDSLLAYEMAATSSVDVRKSLTTGNLAQNESSGSGILNRLANVERLLSALVDKELAVYLDGEELAQNSYRHQGAIMAREGI